MTLLVRTVDVRAEGFKLSLTQGFGGGISVRGKDYVVPALAGRIAMPRIADVRTLLIEGWVSGIDWETWRYYTDLFHEIFDPEAEAGEIVVVGPYLGVAADAVYSIDARTLNVMPGPIQSGGGGAFQHWSVELEATSPEWTVLGSSGS